MTGVPRIGRTLFAGLLAFPFFTLSTAAALADDYSPYGINNSLISQDVPGGKSVQFMGSETGSFESNPLLLVGDHQKSLWGSVTSPEVILSDKTPTSLLSADLLLNENVFNQSSFDSTDIHSKFGANTQSARWGAGAQIATDYDTSRTSELFPGGVGGTLSDTAVRHLGLSLAPHVSYSPTSADKIDLLGSLADSQYESSIFQNYGLASVTPTYSHSFDARNAGVFQVQASRYQTTSGPSSTTDSVGPTVGWRGILSQRLTANANVGFQGTHQYGGTAQSEPWTVQYTFSGDIAYKSLQDKADLSLTRTDSPFADGSYALLTSIAATEQHNLNALFAANIGASYQVATYQSQAAGNLNDIITGTGGITYHATERVDIAATYQYRRETLISTNGTANDNLITIGLVWRPKPLSF